MLNKSLLVLIFYIIINLSRQKTYNIDTNIQPIIERKTFIKEIHKKETEDLLATISIKSINLTDKPIYNTNSKNNNIDKNITILKESILPDKNNSTIFIAAHSGIGSVAYFKNLHKININDKIYFNYKNNVYIYKVVNKYEVDKTGYINFKKDNQNKLILTTCSTNENKQLIVEATET